MEDPLLLPIVGFALLLCILAFVGRHRNYRVRSRFRRAAAASLWVVNAMFFGGVASPIEKGKVINVRKRDVGDEKDDPDHLQLP